MVGLNILFFLAPLTALIGLVVSYLFHKNMKKEDSGTKKMQKIAKHVREGAKAYLWQQYKVVAIFFLVAFVFFLILAYVLKVQSIWVPFAFLTGGFFSALAGYYGMNTATLASVRTTNAARKSLNKALKIAFRSGSVLGLTVVGFGLLYISVWFYILYHIFGMSLPNTTSIMLSFGIGASSQALFARVGGGIYTKAADVGADLVGKVEEGLPEDDLRNPAAIADNVGDNVGDVAGMGADLYESYCGSILASAALGVAAGYGYAGAILPMIISGIGIFLSIIGILAVKTKEGAKMNDLLKSLNNGIHLSAILIVVASYFIVKIVLPGAMGVFGAIIIGLIVGIVIGKSTEYYTSYAYSPTKKIAKHAKTGPATVIISGIGTGMISTVAPVISVVLGILGSYISAGGMNEPSKGLYGIAIAAVGMLSTLGITLATDAYGPIADNAGGNAEMTNLPKEVRERTDALDSLGNTTAATGKGFAIGSAALTALALIAAYVEEVRMSLIKYKGIEMINGGIKIAEATLKDFMTYFNITLSNPAVLIGLFCGSMLAFAFGGLTINAVGKAAGEMVAEVRRQFSEKKGILKGTEDPDYESCVKISTKAAQKEMIIPSLLAIVVPIIIGLILGVAGVMGLLAGTLVSAFVLAIFMANSGGAWDNAKKYIETGKYGGKGSDAHDASIIGDTVGDPFKDTTGPSLNILIKLMSMVSVVVAGLVVSYSWLNF
ncbi:MAG TPA: sodium-translocating pyrophosphatase [Candidatus Mcinerneyibacterium sp.]|nr:sodium-translocating pyrophosphatase [Candidatus Mcinerneyibacterium sp.]